MSSPGQHSGRAPRSRAAASLWEKAGRSDARRRTVEIGRGVRMSCQELGEDVAVIHFVCPPPPAARPRKRRPAPKT